MREHIAFTLVLALSFAASPVGQAQTVRPASERTAQRHLPMSHDALWTTLRTTQIHVDQRQGIFTARPPPAVRALTGRTLTLTGYMLPLENNRRTNHFLLSKYTPVCFFCPPGDPNEVVEVWTTAPVVAGYDRVRVTGRFSLINNGDQGLFFRMDHAAATRG